MNKHVTTCVVGIICNAESTWNFSIACVHVKGFNNLRRFWTFIKFYDRVPEFISCENKNESFPGAAHISKTAWWDFTSMRRVGIIETSSCRVIWPASASAIIHWWNPANWGNFRTSVRLDFKFQTENFQTFSPQICAPSETVGIPLNWLGWSDYFSILKGERFNILQMHVFHIVQQNLSLITKASHTKTHWKGSSHRSEKIVMFLNYDVINWIVTHNP